MIVVEETDKRFYLKESTIKAAGMGVFAKESLKKGDYLEIIGVAVKVDSIANQCTAFAANYKFAAKAADYDRLIIPMGYGGMVNHTDGQGQNAQIEYKKGLKSSHAGQAAYVFTRDIEAGEEILGNYGDHWDALFKWSVEYKESAEKMEKDWETFLKYDLYNLGSLQF
jgi:hypothetical protein